MGNAIKVSTYLFYAALMGLASCGGGGSDGSGDGGNVTINATVGSSYTVAVAPSFLDHVQDAFLGKRAMAIASGTMVDTVVAIPTYQGSYGPSLLEIMASSDIESDGGFSLSLDSSYEWILLLVDSTATSKGEKVVGYVAATIDTDNTLIAFSGQSITSSLDLGTLSKSADEARSSRSGTENAASFNLSIDDLKSIAKSDGGYKHLINLYLNYDPLTKNSYLPQLQYGWIAGTIAAAGNTDPQASDISNYAPGGFDITIETNTMTEDLKDGICGSTTTAELIPPASFSSIDSSLNWSNVSGFKNDGIAENCSDTGCNNMGVANTAHWLQDFGDESRYYCYDGDFSAQITTDYSGSLIGLGTSLNIQIPANGIPQGLWIYKVNGTEVAWFDLAAASPVSASGVFDTTPIPGIRVNHNSGGEITGLVVKWFQYDPALAQYVALTADQITAMATLVSDTFIDVMDEDGTDPVNNPETVHLYSNGATEISSTGLHDGSSIVFPTGTGAWFLPGSSGDQVGNLVPTHIRLGMHMGGSLYNFSWNN